MSLSQIIAGPGSIIEASKEQFDSAMLKMIMNQDKQQQDSIKEMTVEASKQTEATIQSFDDQASALKTQGTFAIAGAATSFGMAAGMYGLSVYQSRGVNNIDEQIENITDYRARVTNTEPETAEIVPGAKTDSQLKIKLEEEAAVMKGQGKPSAFQEKASSRLVVKAQDNRELSLKHADELREQALVNRKTASDKVQNSQTTAGQVVQPLNNTLDGVGKMLSAEDTKSQGEQEALKTIFGMLVESWKANRDTSSSVIQTVQQMLSQVNSTTNTVFGADSRA